MNISFRNKKGRHNTYYERNPMLFGMIKWIQALCTYASFPEIMIKLYE